jgi:hypothetical protein
MEQNYIIRNPKSWIHLKEVSVYNHNYYKNPATGEILLEECDDEDLFDYFLVDENLKNERFVGSYLWYYYDGEGWIWNGDQDIELKDIY